MDKNNTKIFILVVAVLAVIISVGSGIFFYSLANSILTDRRDFDKLDWTVRLDQYERIEALDIDQELYMAFTDKADYLIDGRGKRVTQPADHMRNNAILIVFSEGEKQGYKHPDGTLAIKAKFDEANDFDGGYAKVSENGSDYFVIDVKGRTVFEPGERAFNLEQIIGKYFIFEQEHKRQVVNIETGQIMKKEGVDFYEIPYKAGKELYAAKTDFSWDDVEPMYLLDGNFIPMFSGQLYGQIGSFGQGLCYVQKLVGATRKEHEDYQIEIGYMNADGEIVLTTDDAVMGCKFAEGRALIYEKERVCCIDQAGRILFSLKLAKAFEENPDADFEYVCAQCYFRNGKAIVYDGKCYGLVDENGNWVIRPVFDEMTYAGADKLLVMYKGKSGMIRVK